MRKTIANMSIGFMLALPVCATAQDTNRPDEPEQIIQPEIDRRDIDIPKIDALDLEIGAYTGTLSIENFGAKSVTGYRLSFHITEDIFIEGAYAESTVSDEAFRRLGPIPIFPMQEEELTYYNLSIGINLFPGEVFIGRKWAMTSAVYIIGGAGTTEFINEKTDTFNFGMGIRILPTDWIALRFEMRDYVFDSDLLGKNERTHNFELNAGLSIYF